ncbi:MAG: hypothetical protein R3E79_47730 [Caldilineaceae bacterium]
MLPSMFLLPLAGGLLVWLTQNRRAKSRLQETPSSPPARPATTEENEQPADLLTVEQNLALSVGLLGMTTVGSLGLPLLRLISMPGLLYLNFYFIRNAYSEWRAERRVGIALSDAVLTTGLLATRQLGAGSLFATLFFTSRKLEVQAEHHLSAYLHTPSAPIAVTPSENDESPNQTTLALPAASWLGQPQEEDAQAVPGQAPLVNVSPKATWQNWIDQGALPLLTLSAVTSPALGAKRSLAVLLSNFGYDYRLTAPVSTLSYLKLAGAQGIWVSDRLVLDQLDQIDVLVVDVDWHDQHIAALHADNALPSRIVRTQAGVHDSATVIAQLQAAGHTVAYLSNNLSVASSPGADIYIAVAGLPVAPAMPAAHVILSSGEPLQIQRLFGLVKSLAANQKRGFYLALAPSLINLSGIYFGHFSVVTALLVDYGGVAVGMLNSMWPQLQVAANQEEMQHGTT